MTSRVSLYDSLYDSLYVSLYDSRHDIGARLGSAVMRDGQPDARPVALYRYRRD